MTKRNVDKPQGTKHKRCKKCRCIGHNSRTCKRRCKNCQSIGHNSRTCKGHAAGSSSVSALGKTRLRTRRGLSCSNFSNGGSGILRITVTEMTETNSDNIIQKQPVHTPLICGLPDDIAVSCLARVPRRYHTVLKCVSKRWKDLVCSREWLSCREKNNLTESWIYVLCKGTTKGYRVCFYVLDLNSSKRSWELVSDVPPNFAEQHGTAFQVLGTKLYLLGSCGLYHVSDEVYCYDALKKTWVEAAPLLTARCFFACEALNDKLYAIGGHGLYRTHPGSVDTYDPSTNSWTSYSDPNIVLYDIEETLVLDGKIYIRCRKYSCTKPPKIYVYEPSISGSTWKRADEDLVSGWSGPAVVVDGNLYVLEERRGFSSESSRLKMWQKESREWVVLETLSTLLTRPPCRLAAVGNSIVVVGNGLSTVVLDVGRKGGATAGGENMGGVVVSYHIPGLCNNPLFEIIGCNVVSI